MIVRNVDRNLPQFFFSQSMNSLFYTIDQVCNGLSASCAVNLDNVSPKFLCLFSIIFEDLSVLVHQVVIKLDNNGRIPYRSLLFLIF